MAATGHLHSQYQALAAFFIGSGGNTPLAVTLSDVSAANSGRYNHIDWRTATEEAGDYFEVERSLDAAAFSSIGGLHAKNLNGGSYTLTDEAPAIGVNYYRIKTISANSDVQYSKVVDAAVTQGSIVVEAYPNPAIDKLTVRITGTPGSHAAAHIFDAVNRQVSSIPLTGIETTISMSTLASGIYLLEYRDDKQTRHIKIIKQ
ncbi:T9SS type A sorting domain-containing protein [Chitinophagaceae bacterium MMS25-I14]